MLMDKIGHNHIILLLLPSRIIKIFIIGHEKKWKKKISPTEVG